MTVQAVSKRTDDNELAVCENCGGMHKRESLQFYDIYQMTMCDDCAKALAKEMEECDKQLADEGNL